MSDNKRKCMVICLLALFIGLMGIVLPEQEDIAFEYIVNNTDLYNNGRLQDVTYTANDSAIQLFLIFHVVGTGASLAVDTNLSINGTVVEDRDYRTTAGAGVHEHFSMTAHIPKGANYSVTNSSNLETIEWREYPILSGKNGTLSVNITQGGGTGSQNLSQVLTQGNQAINQTINYTSTNGGKWVTIGYDAPNDLMAFTTSQIMYYKQGSTFLGFTGSGFAYSAYADRPMRFGQLSANNSAIQYNTTHGTRWQGVGTAANRLNITGFDKVNIYQTLDMNNNTITNILITQNQSFNNWSINNIENIDNNRTITTSLSPTGRNLHGFNTWISEGITAFNTIVENGLVVWSLATLSNTTSDTGYFGAHRAGWNSTTNTMYPLLNNTNMFIFYGKGYSGRVGAGGFEDSNPQIRFETDGNWSPGSAPTRIEMNVRNTAGTISRIKIDQNANVTIPSLAGSGNAYVCVDANGKLYRGSPGC